MSVPPAGVRRCVCRDVSFEHILREAARLGADFERLSEATGFGTGCGMCRPYVRRVLQTGNPVQPVLSAAEFDALNREDPAITPRL